MKNMSIVTRNICSIALCLVVFVSVFVTGCSNFAPTTETSFTQFNEADLKNMYQFDIHKAFPVLGTTSEYSNDLNEPAMYYYLYVYNTEKSETDEFFKELTLDEVKDYLLNSELTLDYLNSNQELTITEIIEIRMNDRLKDYYEWFWGIGDYKTDDFDNNSGTQKIERYRNSLQQTLIDLQLLYPNELSVSLIDDLSVEQIKVLIEYNGRPEDIQGDDLVLFM